MLNSSFSIPCEEELIFSSKISFKARDCYFAGAGIGAAAGAGATGAALLVQPPHSPAQPQ
jgi:hypothetical protein